MRRLTDGEFEVHLTTSPDASGDRLPAFAARHGWKSTYIELDRGEHRGQPMLTYYAAGSETTVLAGARTVADLLAAEGFPVLRIKLEARADDPAVPQHPDEASGYFECHLRVAVDGRPGELLDLAVRHGAHLSRNAARTAGPERRFVTQRAHSVGAPAARLGFEALRAAVQAAGFVIDKVEQEYVVFDSRLALDRGWLAGPDPRDAAAPADPVPPEQRADQARS